MTNKELVEATPIYYTLKETAEILRVSERTIHNYLKSGKLKGKKVGKSYRIKLEDIKALAE